MIAKTRLSLSERTFRCECGYTADRDVNAAQTILALAEVNQVGVDGVSRPERTPVLDGAT
ncbi:zinc ribbon domain-containing protein [Changpingibacter yushuensis]|uniref:zinc ribbon domain-containing protein n=1 Tax=Changpingibacter yushuensis TaxID=2758440 RepID=UPI001C710756